MGCVIHHVALGCKQISGNLNYVKDTSNFLFNLIPEFQISEPVEKSDTVSKIRIKVLNGISIVEREIVKEAKNVQIQNFKLLKLLKSQNILNFKWITKM